MWLEVACLTQGSKSSHAFTREGRENGRVDIGQEKRVWIEMSPSVRREKPARGEWLRFCFSN